MSVGRGIVYGAVAGAVRPVRQRLRCHFGYFFAGNPKARIERCSGVRFCAAGEGFYRRKNTMEAAEKEAANHDR